MSIVYIALGGAVGAVLRYLVGLAVVFPFGTLAVNVLGSFLIGLAFVFMASRQDWSLFAITGLLGGFTTFSAFSLDIFKLYEAGKLGAAAGYASASVVLSVLAVFVGVALARGFAS